MKRSRFIEKQIDRAVTQVDAGVLVQELCYKCGAGVGRGYRGSWWDGAMLRDGGAGAPEPEGAKVLAGLATAACAAHT